MRKSRLLSIPLSVALLATALPLLVRASSTEIEIAQTSPASKPASINVVGVIKFVEVEGGCYRLEAANGRSYQLLGRFPRRDGLRVQVRGRLLQDTATICQIGQPLQVESVKVLERDRPQRALEVNIFGIGPAVDAQAVAAVRSVIGRSVAEGAVDTYLTYGYGIEGGMSSCLQLSPFQNSKKLLQLRSELLRVKPNRETTAYSIKAVPVCTQQPRKLVQLSDRLANTTWLLEDLAGAELTDGSQTPTLRFTGVERIGGQGGCNLYSAESRINGSRFTVGTLVATKKACLDSQAQNQESRYFRALENAQRISLEGQYLLIYSQGFDQPLRFSQLMGDAKTSFQ